ncbi:MFS transporter [bacterium]|nr:MFS transporter [bacterium]
MDVSTGKMSADELNPQNRLNLRDVFRALRHRNYRLFFMGQGLSLIGTWITSVTVGWLVYRLTNSALLLGLVGFAGQIATFLLAPFAGVLVDRWNKHRILLITQALFLLGSTTLTILVLTGIIQVWHIIVVSVILGFVNGFDMPTRQAFIVSMIEDREDLPNAIALNSSMFNSARLIGPAIAGVLIAAVGEGFCFMIDAVSYLAVIAALLAMTVTATTAEGPHPAVLRQLREGLKFTFGFPPVRAIILLLAIISFVSVPYTVLMPIFATKIIGGGASILGFLTAASGLGALSGAVFLASRKSVLGLGKWIPLAAGILGLGLIAFSFSRTLWTSIIFLIATGFGMITQMASCNTILQTIVDDNIRGRVMSFYTVAFLGMAPFGSLAGGALANRIGAPHTVFLGGAAAIVAALVFARQLPALRTLIRPIYCERGILPPNLCGVQTYSEIAVPPEQR